MNQQRLLEVHRDFCKQSSVLKSVLPRLMSALRAPGRLADRGYRNWRNLTEDVPRVAGQVEGAMGIMGLSAIGDLLHRKPLEGIGESIGRNLVGEVNTAPQLDALAQKRWRRYAEEIARKQIERERFGPGAN